MAYSEGTLLALSVLGASVASVKSSEGAESRKAFALALDAASKVGRSLSGAWAAVKNLWRTELGDESKIESTDEYLRRAGTALKTIATSEEVKSSLANATESTVKSTQEIGTATVLFAKKLSSELSESEEWNQAVSDLGNSLSMLVATISAAAAKTISARQERQLPPPSNI